MKAISIKLLECLFFRKQVDQQQWQGLQNYAQQLRALPVHVEAHIWDVNQAPPNWSVQACKSIY